MLEPTNRHGGPARPWDIEELHLMNGRGLGHGHPATGPRVIKRISTMAEQFAADWQAADRWTRAFLRELIRVGYGTIQIGANGLVYVSGVGRVGLTLVLTADVDAEGVTVERVTWGREVWTARQATMWLRDRVAR